jgi:hypothetical protein
MINNSCEFILSHFKGQEFMYPRSIMTSKTNGQVFVENKEEMVKYFTSARNIDCRINGYPRYTDLDKGPPSPTFIFIDLDLSLCSVCKYPIRKLDYILGQTLKKIKEEINGQPSVLWTGGGYHIYQPIKIVTKEGKRQALKDFKEIQDYTSYIRNDLTTEFIRFVGKYLTNDKGDPKHNPSVSSCLIRIPETVNSKHNETVKIVQPWNGIEAIANSITLPFMDHLKQLKYEFEDLNERKTKIKFNEHKSRIIWIEKLLATPIGDHRYYCLWHILIPYLVNIKKLSKVDVIDRITQWLDECSKVETVKWRYPETIEEQLRYDKGYPPISLENLKKENFELYRLLMTN